MDAHAAFGHEPELRPEYAETFALFGHLAYKVKPLRNVLALHLYEVDGEMLPHVLMQDVLDWLLEQVNAGPSGLVRTVLDILDAAYVDGSEDLQAVMVVSFLEAIPGFAGRADDAVLAGKALRMQLGPTLASVLAHIEQARAQGANPQG